jgi:hypothetical protein
VTEQDLRAWIEASNDPLAKFIVASKGGGEWMEPRPLAPLYHGIRSTPGMCLATAVEVCREFNLPIACGFSVPVSDPVPRVHFWNTDGDGVVDASWTQRSDVYGYIGFRPNRLELSALAALNVDRVVANRVFAAA